MPIDTTFILDRKKGEQSMNDSKPKTRSEIFKNGFHYLRNALSLLIESKFPFVPFHHPSQHLKM